MIVWNEYGGGAWWPAKATREWVVEGLDPWDDSVERHVQDGRPDWATDALT